eukprot:MONOS_14236.1-p1 / transcript=MONOS_14236.1 / gene=MONOS_14236 / organism=Monocercomonoides_exilis_PA203 / gene_product=reverse transcriptase / transcript_product=reverse transcriptase / location=Mono_scaffold00961:9-743(-) / protein_length=245 / sequence_SO=supercontig / SO=protein_coding / is_pseudo=false
MSYRDGAELTSGEHRRAFMDLLEEQTRTGIVEEINQEDVKHRNNVFLIKKKNGTWRQILDCRRLNAAVLRTHFKCDSERTVERILLKEDWAVTIDLHQAYYLLPVSENLKPYLAFRFLGKDYVFKGMPFGFVDAPRIFTHVMRKVTKEIRRRWHVRLVAYLDDLLILHQDQMHLRRITEEIVQFLESLGLLVNKEKSHLSASREFVYLGYRWNTEIMEVQLKEDRRIALMKEVDKWKVKAVKAKK